MTETLENDGYCDLDDMEIKYVEPPEWMTAREYLSLSAIRKTVAAIGRPTFLRSSHWVTHRRLVRRGYIKWEKQHPEFGKGFAAVSVTVKGKNLLNRTEP